jgi:hypothetical protein
MTQPKNWVMIHNTIKHIQILVSSATENQLRHHKSEKGAPAGNRDFVQINFYLFAKVSQKLARFSNKVTFS